MTNYKKKIGDRLKAERIRNHLTQEKLAEKLDISVKHYSSVERGITGLSVENLASVSDILGISLDYLIKGAKEDYHIPKRVEEIYLNCPDEQKPWLLELWETAMKFRS